MLTSNAFDTTVGSECDCCHIADEESGEAYGCQERAGVFTAREQRVLLEIREIRDRATRLKSKIGHLTSGSGDQRSVERLVEELKQLRYRRAELEHERLAAADERMRLLGHNTDASTA